MLNTSFPIISLINWCSGEDVEWNVVHINSMRMSLFLMFLIDLDWLLVLLLMKSIIEIPDLWRKLMATLSTSLVVSPDGLIVRRVKIGWNVSISFFPIAD